MSVLLQGVAGLSLLFPSVSLFRNPRFSFCWVFLNLLRIVYFLRIVVTCFGVSVRYSEELSSRKISLPFLDVPKGKIYAWAATSNVVNHV